WLPVVSRRQLQVELSENDRVLSRKRAFFQKSRVFFTVFHSGLQTVIAILRAPKPRKFSPGSTAAPIADSQARPYRGAWPRKPHRPRPPPKPPRRSRRSSRAGRPAPAGR